MAQVQPPRGLFNRIIKRLGLEKQLGIIRRNLGFFSAMFIGFTILFTFAVIGLREVLDESSFGPLLSLLFSDPGAVIANWHSFIFSVFESMPTLAVAVLILALAFLLFSVRLIAVSFGKFSSLAKKIRGT